MVAGPKVAAGALTFAFNVWLLRIWTPEQYGLYAICTTVIMLTDAILGSSIDLATLRLSPSQRQADPAVALATERAAFQMKVGAVACALPVVWLTARPLSRMMFHEPGLEALMAFTMAGAVALLLLRSVLVHAQVEQRFRQYALLEVVHSALKFGGIGLLLLLKPNVTVYAVLAPFVIGPLAAFGMGMAIFRDESLWCFRLERAKIAELFRYVKWYALSGGLGNLVGRMDLFILNAYTSLRPAGIFAAGQTFAMVPWLVASYLSVVLSPRIMPHLEAGTCREFYRRAQILLAAVAVLAMLFVAATIDSALALLPTAFRESADIFLILLAGNLISFCTFPVALPLVMFIRPRFVVLMDCIAFPVLFVVYSLAVSWQGTIGVAWVTTASLFVRGGLVQVLAWRLSGQTRGQ